MNNQSNIGKQDTLTRVVCTFVFSLFAFFYLYYYQADLLTLMQHVLSKGQTHYNHLIGAVLITLVLLLIQVGGGNMCRKIHVAWALTYFPSALLLAMLTGVCTSSGEIAGLGGWLYGVPVVLCLFVLILWCANTSGFSNAVSDLIRTPVRRLWINLSLLLVAMLVVCSLGNGNKDFHTRIHAEQCCIDGNYNEALDIIGKSSGNDENLTMLTAYALSREGKLAESLFEYNLNGGSRALIPYGTDLKFVLLPDSTFFLYLGGWYRQSMKADKYLDYQHRHNLINKNTADYLLCGYLLDKKLDEFAANVGKYYQINDSVRLPKHYMEALTLYNHLRSNPLIVYKDNVMEADYQDFQKMETDIKDKRELKNSLRDVYGNTYWYYYMY